MLGAIKFWQVFWSIHPSQDFVKYAVPYRRGRTEKSRAELMRGANLNGGTNLIGIRGLRILYGLAAETCH